MKRLLSLVAVLLAVAVFAGVLLNALAGLQ